MIGCAAALALLAVSIVPDSSAWVKISGDELRQRYDELWAVSDVHGRREETEQLLLGAGLAVRAAGGEVRWNPARSRQLLVVVGDLIDGGPDSEGVVLLFDRLVPQAEAAGSRVLVLLGNHEARFLSHERNRKAGTEYSRFLGTLPVAAFIGDWLFAHAGYIDAGSDPSSLRAFFDRMASDWDQGGDARYRPLRASRSILEYHDWWASKERRSEMRARLETLGLQGLVFGHDPDALWARRAIAINRKGWLVKLDTGMKAEGSRGMLLRCDVRTMQAAAGMRACRVSDPDGSIGDLPVR